MVKVSVFPDDKTLTVLMKEAVKREVWGQPWVQLKMTY